MKFACLFYLKNIEKPFKVFKSLWSQMLELTHNHGSEAPDFDGEKYVNLDTDPLQVFDSLTFASKTEVEGEKDGKLVDPDGYVVNMVRRE